MKIKKMLATALVTISIVSTLSGCSSQNIVEDNINLSTIKIDCETDLDVPDKVNVYSVSEVDTDTELLKETFLTSEVTETLQQNNGLIIYTDNEILIDETPNTVAMDGFSYSRQSGTSNEDLMEVCLNAPLDYGAVGEMSGEAQLKFDNMFNYKQEENLYFEDYSQIQADFLKLTDKLNVGEIEIQYAFSMDHDTMNQNKNLVDDFWLYISNDYDKNTYIYDEDDDAYFFVCRQVIDDIPITNYTWQNQEGKVGKRASYTALYDKNGLANFDCGVYYETGDIVEEKNIISPDDAIKAFEENYNKAIRLYDTTIVGFELNYAVFYNEYSQMRISPIYVVNISTEIDTEAVDNTEITSFYDEEYDCVVVDAITGEVIKTDEVEFY